MKKLAMIALIAAMCCGVAGCAGTSSDSENTVEQTEIQDTENETSSENEEENEDAGTEAGEGEIGSEEAGAEDETQETEDQPEEQTADEENADAYIGSYFCGDTAMNLTVTASENEGYDYTFTWSDGVDWESSYDAVAGDGELTITIQMKSDVILTITADDNGLTIVGDDAYNSEVVENRRLDGAFEKAQ